MSVHQTTPEGQPIGSIVYIKNYPKPLVNRRRYLDFNVDTKQMQRRYTRNLYTTGTPLTIDAVRSMSTIHKSYHRNNDKSEDDNSFLIKIPEIECNTPIFSSLDSSPPTQEYKSEEEEDLYADDPPSDADLFDYGEMKIKTRNRPKKDELTLPEIATWWFHTDVEMIYNKEDLKKELEVTTRTFAKSYQLLHEKIATKFKGDKNREKLMETLQMKTMKWFNDYNNLLKEF